MTRPSLLFRGALHRPSSFALINQRLVAGLRQKGWPTTVCPTDRGATRAPRFEPPDVYLFHDHPYDVLSAPGRVNAFILSYDYARFVPADRSLAAQLNDHFDVLFVPTRFVKRVCRRNGVRIPIHLCPWGVDRRDIHPGPQVRRDADDRFRFLYLGGATERKGCDLLLRAFFQAFTNEAVSLTIKAFAYDDLLPWMEAVMTSKGVGRSGRPPVTFEHGHVRSVGQYYRDADSGVFPFRGEGFGLPILECLASGRPVIVTRGGGPLDFCRRPFATFIQTKIVQRDRKIQFRPEVHDLARLMRQMVERGRPHPASEPAISRSVADFTWDRTIDILDRVLRSVKPRHWPSTVRARPPARHGARMATRVAYAYFEKGRTSWKYTSLKIDACLRRHFASYVPLPAARSRLDINADIVVGQAGFCLGRFLDARRRNPACRMILVRENGPIEVVTTIQDRERRLMKCPPRSVTAFVRWTHRSESERADRIVVLSEASRGQFVAAGYPASKLRVVRPGIKVGRLLRARNQQTIRFLFVGSDPFRKGIRVLLAAWDRLRLRRAELMVVAPNELLQSPQVLRSLVSNPSIRVESFVPNRWLHRLDDNIDCHVLPTFEDGFSNMVAEGMGRGRPAIVSRAAGVSELIEHGRTGLIVDTGSVTALADAMQWVSEHRARLGTLGEAAYEAARQHPWSLFERRLVACLEER